jgi:hypothetical protein
MLSGAGFSACQPGAATIFASPSGLLLEKVVRTEQWRAEIWEK